MPGRPRRRARVARRNPADLIPAHTLVILQHTVDYEGTQTIGPYMSRKAFSPSAEYEAYQEEAARDWYGLSEFAEWLTNRGCIRSMPHAVIDTGTGSTYSLDAYTKLTVKFER